MANATDDQSVVQEPVVPPAQPPVAEQPVEEVSPEPTPQDDLADIEKPVEPRTWIFEGEFTLKRGDMEVPQAFKGEYVQKPLSYFAFLEFTGLLARKIDEAMRGPDGITVQDIVDTAQAAVPYIVDGSNIEAVIDEKKFDGLDSFVQGFMKLASYVPDVIEECQFIWLRVPRRDRGFLRDIWGRPADEGGMSNDEGEEMLSIFIEQNYEELEAFFAKRLPRILGVATKARQTVKNKTTKSQDESPRSKPWSPTAEPTLSQ